MRQSHVSVSAYLDVDPNQFCAYFVQIINLALVVLRDLPVVWIWDRIPDGGFSHAHNPMVSDRPQSHFWQLSISFLSRLADSWMLKIVREGPQLSFLAPPLLSHQPLVFFFTTFGTATFRKVLEDMLLKWTVEEVCVSAKAGFFSRLLLVPKTSRRVGEWR